MQQKPRVLFTGFTDSSGELAISAHVAMALDGKIFDTFLGVGRVLDTLQSRSLRDQLKDTIANTAPAAVFCLGRTSLAHISIEPRVDYFDPASNMIRSLASTLPVDKISAVIHTSTVPVQRRPQSLTAEDVAVFYGGLHLASEMAAPIPLGLVTLPEHPLSNYPVEQHVSHLAHMVMLAGQVTIAV